MDRKNINVVFSSSFDEVVSYNSSFDKGVLRICYTGENRNGTYFSKDSIIRAIKSIFNCPIVCKYDREYDEIGSHDCEVILDKDGEFKIVNLTHPVGVIPESANYWFDNVVEEDGSVHEYLFVDALLWKRQEAYEKIKNDGITDQSMEIHIKHGHMSKDGVYVIEDFEFNAFCLLGIARPCFESAALQTFSLDAYKNMFIDMMSDFKSEAVFTENSINISNKNSIEPSKEVTINTNDYSEGGGEVLDNKNTLMEQYNLTIDMIDFNLEDFSIEELTAKFEEIKKAAEIDKEKNDNGKFELAGQFFEELMNSLKSEQIETFHGDVYKYWYVDHDTDLMEVYCYDYENWKLYGFNYSFDGDNVNIDFQTKKRKKFAVIDFDEGEKKDEQDSVFFNAYSEISEKFKSAKDELSDKYDAASKQVNDLTKEIEGLKEYKVSVEKNIDKQKKDELFEMFSDLEGDASFASLQSDYEKFTIDEIEEKCFAIRGRKQVVKFSAKKLNKLPIEKDNPKEDDLYGGIFQKYGITND